MLAFAVFAWGLHYKLSLYHSGSRANAAPAAKLLSPRERPDSNLQIDELLLAGRPLRVQAHHFLPETVATVQGFDDPISMGRSRRLPGLEHNPNVPGFPELTLGNPRAPPIKA
jgi:hypothetical protein